jgi:hypothetical protein
LCFLSDLCGQKLLTAECAEKSQSSQRSNLVTRFGYPDQGLRVSGSIALSGVAEKMKAHWKPGLRITKKDVASYVSTKANLKILEN